MDSLEPDAADALFPTGRRRLEKIRPYEPNVVKAAWNIFGKSYEYRMRYNKYKNRRCRKRKI